MSDGALSQDEIDALLTGGLDMNFDDVAAATPASNSAPQAASSTSVAMPSSSSSPIDINSIASVYGQNVGKLDQVLKSLLDETSVLSAPTASFSNRNDLLNTIGDEVVFIRADFAESASGPHFYILATDMAASMAGKMQGLAQAELNEAGIGALEEAINTVAGTTSTFLSIATGKSVSCGVASGQKALKATLSGIGDQFVKLVYPYRFDGVGASEIIEIISTESASALFAQAQHAANPMQMGGAPMMNQMAMGMGAMPNMMNQMPAMAAAPGMMGQMQMGMMPGMFSTQNVNMPQGIQPVQFTSLNNVPSSAESGNISLLMDVFMEMTVELGRTKRLIKDILGMGEGTIIELDKLAGEPVDILVNHKLIAKGEVVVIDENFGVRVTEIVSPMERVSEV